MSMSLYQYFRPANEDSKLQDPHGPPSEVISLSSIASANEEMSNATQVEIKKALKLRPRPRPVHEAFP